MAAYSMVGGDSPAKWKVNKQIWKYVFEIHLNSTTLEKLQHQNHSFAGYHIFVFQEINDRKSET